MRSRLDAWYTGAFLLLAVFVTSRQWLDPAGRTAPKFADDPAQAQWFLAHTLRWLTHGENPFLTTRLNVPDGVNLMANTPILGLAVPVAPVTWLLGPAVAYLLLVTLALAGTATAWYFVLSRHVVASRAAAAVGAAFCGFAPALVSHANWHPNICAQFLIPFILWHALELRKRPVRNGIILGLLVTWQAFINEEILLFTALAVAVFILFYALKERRAWRPFLAGLGVTALVAGALLAYPLHSQFLGPWHYTGLNPAHATYRTDLAGYVSYATESLAGTPDWSRSPLVLNQAEENAFFGWGLLLLLLAATVWQWRDKLIRTVALTALLFAVFSLGRTITWHGHPTGIPGPWRWVSKLPLFDAMVPSRLGLVVTAAFGVLLALLTDRVLRRGGRARWLWAAAVVVAVVPILPTPLETTGRAPVPAFITTGHWKGYVDDGRTLVPVPVPTVGEANAMRWPAAVRLDFALPGGYFLYPRDGIGGNYGVQGAPERETARLLATVAASGAVPVISDAQRQTARGDLRHWRGAVVVLQRTERNEAALHATLDALLGPGAQVDDVWLWDVRDLT